MGDSIIQLLSREERGPLHSFYTRSLITSGRLLLFSSLLHSKTTRLTMSDIETTTNLSEESEEEYKYDLYPTLEMLKKAVKDILLTRKKVNRRAFEKLYMNIYQLTMQRNGDKVYEGFKEVIRHHLKTEVRPKLIDLTGERFLLAVNEALQEHTVSMREIADISLFLDRFYIEQEYVSCSKDRHLNTNDEEWRARHEDIDCAPVFDMGLLIFRKEIVDCDEVKGRLSKVMMQMVAEERAGAKMDWSRIKNAVRMFESFDNAIRQWNKKVYEEQFETPYLQQMSDFYKAASQECIEDTCAVYSNKIGSWISEETERARKTKEGEDEDKGRKTTEPTLTDKVVKTMEEVLIGQHIRRIVDMPNEGMKAMMKNDKASWLMMADLHVLYLMAKRIDGSHTILTDCMSEYFRSIGNRLVVRAEAVAAAAANPVQFIKELMDFKARFDRFLKESFDSDEAFGNKINSDFAFFVNKNARTPEFLAIYIDVSLKKGPRDINETEMEAMIDRSMAFFRFLVEIDVFEKYYKQLLEKRLLLDRYASAHAEKQMIARLRGECGWKFTDSIEKIFRDKEMWSVQAANFKTYCEQKPGAVKMDLSVRMLTAGTWISLSSDGPQSTLPIECQTAFEHFKKYYNSAHGGRKISLNTLLGSAEIKAAFYGQSTQVSTPTMVLLLRFNERPMHTFQQLKAGLYKDTQIPEKELQRCLQSLAMGKKAQRILTRKGKGKEIEDNDEFTVNDLFTSKLTRIRVQIFTDKREPERQETRSKLEVDRRNEMDAAVVRIMKARKVLQHNDLVVEVTEQLQSRFKPDPVVIKKSIESLIEREYLKRDTEDPRVYKYQE